MNAASIAAYLKTSTAYCDDIAVIAANFNVPVDDPTLASMLSSMVSANQLTVAGTLYTLVI